MNEGSELEQEISKLQQEEWYVFNLSHRQRIVYSDDDPPRPILMVLMNGHWIAAPDQPYKPSKKPLINVAPDLPFKQFDKPTITEAKGTDIADVD